MNRQFKCIKDIHKKKKMKDSHTQTIAQLKKMMKAIQDVLRNHNSFVQSYEHFRNQLLKIQTESELNGNNEPRNDDTITKRTMYFHKGTRESDSIQNKTYNGIEGTGNYYLVLVFSIYMILRCTS